MSDFSDVTIIDLGGSVVAPDSVDTEFLKSFRDTIVSYLYDYEERRIVLVCGGGAPAREYQKAYREIAQHPEKDSQDWIGIAATRLNAELLRQIFLPYCPLPVVTDPTSVSVFPGSIMIASGWKPGFSTDYDAVLLAEKFSANTLINLSNIAKVFTADPKTSPEAVPIDNMSWKDFRELVGDVWIPGRNVPFDPVAANHAAEIKLKMIVALGENISNLQAILKGLDFEGTVIGPD